MQTRTHRLRLQVDIDTPMALFMLNYINVLLNIKYKEKFCLLFTSMASFIFLNFFSNVVRFINKSMFFIWLYSQKIYIYAAVCTDLDIYGTSFRVLFYTGIYLTQFSILKTHLGAKMLHVCLIHRLNGTTKCQWIRKEKAILCLFFKIIEEEDLSLHRRVKLSLYLSFFSEKKNAIEYWV